MSCEFVLGLIDAGPFADRPPLQMQAALQHARGCRTCGPALDAERTLSDALLDLSHPLPPRDFTRSVLERVARVEDARSVAHATSSVSQSRRLGAWPVWATTLGACAAAVVAVVLILSGRLSPLEILSVRTEVRGRMAGMPPAIGALAIAASLAVYVAGLFAAINHRKPTSLWLDHRKPPSL